ncbi:MAG: hypothetical protein ACJ8H8_00675 [Geminicoccaceae bacterium]
MSPVDTAAHLEVEPGEVYPKVLAASAMVGEARLLGGRDKRRG